MKFTILGYLVWFQRARPDEPYWWHLDRSGNRVRDIIAVERATASLDELVAWVFILGPWRASIGKLNGRTPRYPSRS
jgi:hypothetical protein